MSEVESAERSRAEALLRSDVDHVAALLHDDLTYVHASGRREDKYALLAGLRAGTRYLEIVHRDLQLRPLDGAAVLTGEARIVLLRAGAATPVTMETRFTQVWTRRNAAWLLMAHHASMR